MTLTFPKVPLEDPDEQVSTRIRRAEAAIAGLKAEFVTWVRSDLGAIGKHFARAAKAPTDADRRSSLEEVRAIAHNIKGQGGTFGCDGLSAVAAELDAFLKWRQDEQALEPTQALIARLWAAFENETA